MHLFTRAGEVLAPPTTRLATARGPVSAEDVQLGKDRLELLTPGDVPAPASPPVDFNGVEATVHAIPEDVADPVLLGELLERARIEHTLKSDGGWLAVRLGRADPAADWTWHDELTLLLELTVWSREGDSENEHRTRIDQRDLRARIVSALVACQQPFQLRWVPTYFPVEARISLTDATPRAFTEVVARREPLGGTVEVELENAASIIVDLAYVRLQRQNASS